LYIEIIKGFLKKHGLTVLFGIFILAAGFALGYVPRIAEKKEEIIVEEKINADAPKLSKNARITYEYRYSDGVTETRDESLPCFLAEMTEKSVEESLGDWELVEFAPESVVIRKILDEKSGQNYILGVYNGYIAVYYENTENGEPTLKEVTDRHISALSDNEAEALIQGVSVTSDDELFRLLQDYGS